MMTPVSVLMLMVALGALTVNGWTVNPFFDPPHDVDPGKPLSQITPHYRQYACTFDNKIFYEHSHRYRYSLESRCVTYICDRGVNLIHQEGCMDRDSGKCVYVGHTWTRNCHTFMCTKKEENGVLAYEGIRNNIGCFDELTGTCRANNEMFPGKDDNGVVHPKCTCRITPGHSNIECFDMTL